MKCGKRFLLAGEAWPKKNWWAFDPQIILEFSFWPCPSSSFHRWGSVRTTWNARAHTHAHSAHVTFPSPNRTPKSLFFANIFAWLMSSNAVALSNLGRWQFLGDKVSFTPKLQDSEHSMQGRMEPSSHSARNIFIEHWMLIETPYLRFNMPTRVSELRRLFRMHDGAHTVARLNMDSRKVKFANCEVWHDVWPIELGFGKRRRHAAVKTCFVGAVS